MFEDIRFGLRVLRKHPSFALISVLTLAIRPQLRFVTTLNVRGGWRDGWQGVVISVLAGVSVASKYAHLWTLQHNRNGQVRNGSGESWPS